MPESQKELEEFEKEVSAWIAENRPAEPEFMLPQSFLEVETDQQFDYLREWQRAVYEAGYLGFDVPAEYGGQGVSPAKQGIVRRELARARTPFMVNLIALQWVAPTILVYGTEEQKQRYLKPLLSAEEIWCQGFSEPDAGSDLASLSTRAVRTGDGYSVTGHKVWTTLAHVAAHMILLARTDPTADNKYKGLSYFLFPMNASGVEVRPLTKMTGEGGFNQVLFDEAPMPADCLLGPEGAGWTVAMTTLTFERGAAQSSNRERAAEDMARLLRVIDVAREARRDGHAAIDDPTLADELAQLWIDLEAMRHSSQRAAVSGLVAERPMALPMMHKLLYSEWHQRLAKAACMALGPEAILWLGDEHAPDGAEWPRAYMNSYGFTIGGGTSEIQRNILGERILGLPKSK